MAFGLHVCDKKGGTFCLLSSGINDYIRQRAVSGQQASQYEIVLVTICISSRIKLPADDCAVGGLYVNGPKASLFLIRRA